LLNYQEYTSRKPATQITREPKKIAISLLFVQAGKRELNGYVVWVNKTAYRKIDELEDL
jgi:hypothetical protein